MILELQEKALKAMEGKPLFPKRHLLWAHCAKNSLDKSSIAPYQRLQATSDVFVLENEKKFFKKSVESYLLQEKEALDLWGLKDLTDQTTLFCEQGGKIEISYELQGKSHFPWIDLFASKDTETFLHIDCKALSSSLIHQHLCIHQEKGSKVKVILKTSGNELEHLHFIRARLKESASLEVVIVHDTPLLAKDSLKIALEGTFAHAEVSYLSTLEEKGQSECQIHMHHKAPQATSHQHIRALQNGRSRSCFLGLIEIDPIAQKTEAYQISRAMLLDPGSFAATEPNLKIHADDVKASHGATICDIDDLGALLYLKSRGISNKEAKQMLIDSFTHPILSKLV